MSTMQHYTVDTGHCRDSHESEVGEGVIAAILPLLRDGLHDLPGFDGYTLRVTVADSTIAATVYSSRWQWRGQKGGDPAPLVTTFVCLDDDGLRGTLRATGAIPAVPLRAPCIIAQPAETMALDRDAVGWLGDFERCLGWAWVRAHKTAR